MAELSIASQSSLLLPRLPSHSTTVKGPRCLINLRGSAVAASQNKVLSISRARCGPLMPFPTFSFNAQQSSPFHKGISAVSDPTVSKLTSNPESTQQRIELDTSGGGGFGGEGAGGGGSGGGGNGGDGNDDSWEGKDEGHDESAGKRANALSMSQKLTLGYAALVGLGGLMGFLKGGSQKSLAAGGLSSLVLYYVYTQLPTKPVFASSIGLGMSAALLVVMGSRFKSSGKVFPAGVVSLISLIMTGGYVHGIFRSSH